MDYFDVTTGRRWSSSCKLNYRPGSILDVRAGHSAHTHTQEHTHKHTPIWAFNERKATNELNSKRIFSAEANYNEFFFFSLCACIKFSDEFTPLHIPLPPSLPCLYTHFHLLVVAVIGFCRLSDCLLSPAMLIACTTLMAMRMWMRKGEEGGERDGGKGLVKRVWMRMRMRMPIGNAEADAHFFSGTTSCPSSPLGLHNTIVHTDSEKEWEREGGRERERKRHTWAGKQCELVSTYTQFA